MPIQVSYPGTYVSAITTPQPPAPSASTSIAAFVGRAPMGPVNQATLVANSGAYARLFGPLDRSSAVSYQANAFFGNGGEQAVIVRLFSAPISTQITVLGTPLAGDTYLLDVTVNGAPVTIAKVTGQTTALDLAKALATALLAGVVPNQGVMSSLISAPTPTEPEITVSLLNSVTTSAATTTISISALAEPAHGSSAAGASVQIGEAESISNTGISSLSLSGGATITVNGTVAIGDVFTIFLTPPGSPAVSLSFPATTTVSDDVPIGLAAAVNANAVAAKLVTASASGSSLSLTYKSAVELDVQVQGQATLELGYPSPFFSLQAANPGVWGDELSVTLVTVPSGPIYQKFGLDPANPQQALFNLSVSYFDGTSYQTESFLNATLYGDATQSNRLDTLLANGSQYLRCTIPNPNTSPPSIPIAPTTVAVGFASGGADSARLVTTDYTGDASKQTGLYALTQLPYGFNMLCVPPDASDDAQGGDQDASVYQEAAQICVDNNAVLIIDPPTSWFSLWQSGQVANISIDDPKLGSYTADQARSSAIYFPRVVIADPLMNGQPKVLPPCGFMAAAWAATDTAVGVWKAPAGLDVPVGGITGLQANLSDDDSGELNPQGINAIRQFSIGGNVVWGARTVYGSDTLNDEYKYLPVRRLLLYIETSLRFGTMWAVFQPNGPSLWSRLQTQISTFMAGLFSQGAFAGTSASQAFFVKCDATTTLPSDQAAGIVNVQVGFAPIYPAEFVVITVSQQTAKSS